MSDKSVKKCGIGATITPRLLREAARARAHSSSQSSFREVVSCVVLPTDAPANRFCFQVFLLLFAVSAHHTDVAVISCRSRFGFLFAPHFCRVGAGHRCGCEHCVDDRQLERENQPNHLRLFRCESVASLSCWRFSHASRLADGVVSVLYEPEMSSNGALLCVAKPCKTREHSHRRVEFCSAHSCCAAARRAAAEQSLEWQPGLGQVVNPLLEAEERKREQKTQLTRKQRLNAGRPELPATVCVPLVVLSICS